jgi:hypothetical protein
MLRASRCFFIKGFQLGGPETRTAVAPFPCNFHIDSYIFSGGLEATDFDFSSARFRLIVMQDLSPPWARRELNNIVAVNREQIICGREAADRLTTKGEN